MSHYSIPLVPVHAFWSLAEKCKFNHFPEGHNEPTTEVKQVKNIICYEQQNWGFKSLPFCRTRTKQFSVFYQGPKFYNTLNTNNINASSPFSFKRALKAFICNSY